MCCECWVVCCNHQNLQLPVSLLGTVDLWLLCVLQLMTNKESYLAAIKCTPDAGAYKANQPKSEDLRIWTLFMYNTGWDADRSSIYEM